MGYAMFRGGELNMKRAWIKILGVGIAGLAFQASPAAAQATRTWISGVGDDVNPCSRTAPCKTFAGAISKTAANGEINCIDPGGFGGVTITKAITLRCDQVESGVLVAGTNGIIINAGANDKVVIDGLDIEGLASSGNSTNGINILSARDVVVRNTSIRGFTAAGTGNGIVVNGANQIALTVEHSFIFNNNVGILVSSSGGNGAARVYDTVIVANANAGVRVTGAGNKAELSGNKIIRTPKAIEILSGGGVSSYGDNVLSTGGDAPTIIPKG
jgi:hypothetical protein